ncbi:MAG: hypothetical protein FWG42_11970 [Clostridiales bacterium]|nr:hypothetical protein [Clostridiales bacterium]
MSSSYTIERTRIARWMNYRCPLGSSFLSKGSDRQAYYDTRTDKDGIIKFYSGLCEPGSSMET